VIPGYTPDDASPGGALAFELLRERPGGTRYVRVAYYAQTLDQMRAQTQFSFADLAARAEINVPGCTGDGPANLCPLPRFLEIASATIDRACVPPGK
jgi:4-phytase/acid phosphatase